MKMEEEEINEVVEKSDHVADKQEISDAGSGSTVVMTIGKERLGHNLVEATTGIISPATAAAHNPQNNLLKVKIEYPKSWKKEKFYRDGDIKEVSRESANTFIEIGIAKLVEPTKTE